MKYNFDEIVLRHHTNSYKWDSATLPDADVGSGYGFSDSSSYYSCAAATCTARHFWIYSRSG